MKMLCVCVFMRVCVYFPGTDPQRLAECLEELAAIQGECG